MNGILVELQLLLRAYKKGKITEKEVEEYWENTKKVYRNFMYERVEIFLSRLDKILSNSLKNLVKNETS